MKRNLRFVSSKYETQRGIQLNDGRILSLFDENNEFYLPFDKEINLDDGTFEDETCVSIGDRNTTCLNNILHNGQGIEVTCTDGDTYFENKYPCNFSITQNKVSRIQKYFERRGFMVTQEAIMHQLCAWMQGYKSGYRDNDNGYFLFTPCGLNPLSIRLTTLHPLCKGWQKTYIC